MTQEEIENLKRSITTKEIELLIKELSSTKMASLMNSKKYFKEELTPSFTNSSQKTEEGKTLPNSFCETIFILILKSDKDT